MTDADNFWKEVSPVYFIVMYHGCRLYPHLGLKTVAKLFGCKELVQAVFKKRIGPTVESLRLAVFCSFSELWRNCVGHILSLKRSMGL